MEFAGSTQIPKKIIRTPNLPIRTKISPKKKYAKEPKIRKTWRNLQAQHNILKKSSKYQIYQSERKFSKKKQCFVPLKCKGAKNSYRGYPTEFAGSTQNVRKNCLNIKSTNQNKKFPIKTIFSTLKV
jgi:hypothetical protein